MIFVVFWVSNSSWYLFFDIFRSEANQVFLKLFDFIEEELVGILNDFSMRS